MIAASNSIRIALLCLAVGIAGCDSAAQLKATAQPSPSHTPLPTHTLTPTASPSATASPVPTPTPTLFPMTIDSLRAGSYPGSDILIEHELAQGANYRRYYASYLSEGLKIYALLTVPDGDPPPGGWPALVFNHGYIPPEVYRTTERYIAYVDTLARHGYVVFRVDYRGHDQSEGEAQGAYGDPGYATDVLNAVASIKKFPGVNPEKIGMWGHSMGGYLTLRTMVVSSDVRAGVIWAGVVASYPEMLYNWRRPNPRPTSAPSSTRRWRDAWIAEFGAPEQNAEFWDSVSATSYLGDLSGPLQLHHATADESVPVEFSVRLAELGRQAGQMVELFIYEGDNHNLSGNFSTAMARTIEFFDRHLK